MAYTLKTARKAVKTAARARGHAKWLKLPLRAKRAAFATMGKEHKLWKKSKKSHKRSSNYGHSKN